MNINLASKTVFTGKTPDGIPYLIRYPKHTDLQGLWRFINNLSKEETFINYQNEEISLQTEKTWLEDILKQIKNKTAVQFVVEINNQIVGDAGIVMSNKAIGKHVGIFGIALEKEFRHLGIGKVLMERIFAEAKVTLPQLKIIVLGVFSNNPIAKNLYEEFGFKEYGRLPKGVLHRGKYVDDIKMYYQVR